MDFNAEKEPSWFPEAKVYHNGSHFIAIPHTKVRRKKRGKPKEEIFVVSEGDPVDKKATNKVAELVSATFISTIWVIKLFEGLLF